MWFLPVEQWANKRVHGNTKANKRKAGFAGYINEIVIWCTFIICADEVKNKIASAANCFRFCFHFVLNSKVLVANEYPRFFTLVRCMCMLLIDKRWNKIEIEYLRSVAHSPYGWYEYERKKKQIRRLYLSDYLHRIETQSSLLTLRLQQLIGWYYNPTIRKKTQRECVCERKREWEKDKNNHTHIHTDIHTDQNGHPQVLVIKITITPTKNIYFISLSVFLCSSSFL